MLALNSQRFACLCLLSAGIKGVSHHHLAQFNSYFGMDFLLFCFSNTTTFWLTKKRERERETKKQNARQQQCVPGIPVEKLIEKKRFTGQVWWNTLVNPCMGEVEAEQWRSG
ncbi:hypothetical protein I79_021888 [Cricetulus griseus]|uniref:Uncharacterized protein n=1 Tax=Cricetulus griseus TaxID=10029 RepID=G3IDV1_CRIGR|nr:hypothetical protein I79_021888 [Cricetulus griseus]